MKKHHFTNRSLQVFSYFFLLFKLDKWMNWIFDTNLSTEHKNFFEEIIKKGGHIKDEEKIWKIIPTNYIKIVDPSNHIHKNWTEADSLSNFKVLFFLLEAEFDYFGFDKMLIEKIIIVHIRICRTIDKSRCWCACKGTFSIRE